MTKEEARQKVAELIAKYQALDKSQIHAINEAQTKQGFIEPLFRALGWDFDDINEVSPEEAASAGRVDYAFKLNNVSRFYLEAKPLKADLTKPEYIKQAITYAYNKGVTWAILCDFEGLYIYVAQTGQQFITLACDKYLSDFEDLWLLSKEAFQSDALSEAAQKYGKLPIRMSVEQRLFTQLRNWREALFNQLHHYNSKLTFNQIDEVIQRLFNRLIFIRNCEDRRIEEKVLLSELNQWRSSKRKGELVERLQRIFREFDGYYDSDLFAYHLTDETFIESDTLENIIDGLYEVPGGIASYDFSVIGADVLGRVYEQYLGHVANVVKQRAKEAQARMELGVAGEETIELSAKKQHRKEQGIYYTPEFVTDYIVKETVGRFIKEHSHNDIINMKILDPACGSGSFLIRAYDELLNYHASQKSKNAAELGQWDRLPILLGSIFGVDLDIQAIEVARLNLLLRALAKRETLPSLKDNIRQGNSLISGSEEELKKYFGKDWHNKHPFNWEQEFKKIMTMGGFDVVIGNPPYVGFQGFEDDKGYLRNSYRSCQGRFDIYLPFLEKGISLLKENGLLGFICPTNFMKRAHGLALREFLKKNQTILQIIDFQDQQVFEEALNYVGIFIIRKHKPALNHILAYIPRRLDGEHLLIKQDTLQDNGWVFRDKSSEKLVSKIKAKPNLALIDVVESISEGIVTGKNDVFVLSSNAATELGLENDLIKPVIQGKQIQRYVHEQAQNVIIYPYQQNGNQTEVIPEQDLQNYFPAVWRYLLSKKQALEGRKYFESSSKNWYELWCERSFSQQAYKKIVVPELAANNRFAYCDASNFYLDTACGMVLKDANPKAHLYLLGLLNSLLLEFYYKKTTVPKASGFYIYKTMFLKRLPIRRIDFGNPTEKKLHDDIVALVEKMLELNKRLVPIRNTYSNERDEVLKEIQKTDKEIDNLVYQLYELTEEEIKIVEGGK